jgi:hypothetical protein
LVSKGNFKRWLTRPTRPSSKLAAVVREHDSQQAGTFHCVDTCIRFGQCKPETNQMRKDRGLAAPILSKCARCKKSFRPHNRSDAEFCSSSCRQAAYRGRSSLKQDLQLAKNLHDADDATRQYEHYRELAVTWHRRALCDGIDDVRFVATPSGIIIVGNYVPWVTYTPRGPDDYGDADKPLLGMPLHATDYRPLRATEYDASDPKVIEALSQRTFFAESSLRRRQHEKGDADTIRTPARFVMLLAFNDDVIGRRLEDPERTWLMTNYADGDGLFQGTMLREVHHGRTDTEDYQSMAKELGLDRLSGDEGDEAQHRDEDEDEGGRGYEVGDLRGIESGSEAK